MHHPRPDLLILDLTLPDGDGFSLVEWLRNQPTLDTLPLVVYSGREISEAGHGQAPPRPHRIPHQGQGSAPGGRRTRPFHGPQHPLLEALGARNRLTRLTFLQEVSIQSPPSIRVA